MRTPPLTPTGEEPHGNRGALERVSEALSLLKPFIDKLESEDPQFIAIKRLAEALGPKALALAIGNALISYRLSGRGEEYWTELAEFFLKNPDKDLVDFLYNSKYNKVLRKQKEARIRKVEDLLKEVERDPKRFADLNLLREELKRRLRAKGNEKTLVFALKMAYYYFKAMGEEVKGDAPLPMDLRISALTFASGLVNAHPDEIMGRKRDMALKAWEEACKRAGVKMINADALVWLAAKGLRESLKRGVDEARKKFAQNLVEMGVPEDVAKRVSELLIVNDLSNE